MHCVNDMDNKCKETLVYLIVIFRYDTTVESRFLEPPGETEIGSRNREFEKSKVASNYA